MNFGILCFFGEQILPSPEILPCPLCVATSCIHYPYNTKIWRYQSQFPLSFFCSLISPSFKELSFENLSGGFPLPPCRRVEDVFKASECNDVRSRLQLILRDARPLGNGRYRISEEACSERKILK